MMFVIYLTTLKSPFSWGCNQMWVTLVKLRVRCPIITLFCRSLKYRCVSTGMKVHLVCWVWWCHTASYDITYVLCRWSGWLEHRRMWESGRQVSRQSHLSVWSSQHIWSICGTYVYMLSTYICQYPLCVPLFFYRILILFHVILDFRATLVLLFAFVSDDYLYSI